MLELTVVARAKARPGKEKELEKELRAVVGPTHREAGCLRYALHRSAQDPGLLIMIERWTCREALDRHFATPHIKRLLEKIPDPIVSPPEISVLESLPEGGPAKGRI